MKNLRKLGIVLTTFLLSLSLVACGSKNTTTEDNTTTAVVEDGKITDREGNLVDLPQRNEKIISLAPSITETLVDLGLADRLIAVDKYSKSVEGVSEDLPIFDIMNPDAENITLLEPDIIFGTGMSKSGGEDPFAPMVELGSFVTVIPTSTSIQGIIDDIIFIGAITGTEQKAQEIADKFSQEIDEISKKVEDANKEITTVYFEAAGQNWTFGENTFLNDMINRLNGKNVFDYESGWSEVSAEQVIEKNPQVILTNSSFLDDPVQEILDRDGWDVIDAVKNKRVYEITTRSKRANEFAIEAFREMAAAMHPELFEN